MKVQNKHLVILFAVLLFGGLWGLVEASIGNVLHMEWVHGTRKLFFSSTTVLLPIAYFLMGGCYKKTGAARSVIYMGILASGIKLISALIFRSKLEPALYMLVEAATMSLALLAIRPKKVISFAGLGIFILASTSYLLLTTFYRLSNTPELTQQKVVDDITKYVFTYNCVAILYTFAIGAAIFGLIKLSEKFSWNMEGVKKVIYSPITAMAIATIMIPVVMVLENVKF